MFFICGGHQDLTKRDDIRKAINRNIPSDEEEVKFGLFQGRRSVSDGQTKIYFRAMLIDVSTDDFEREFILLNKAFHKARIQGDPILGGLRLVPFRPDTTISAGIIVESAKEQNSWCNDTEVSVLRSIVSIDEPLTEKKETE